MNLARKKLLTETPAKELYFTYAGNLDVTKFQRLGFDVVRTSMAELKNHQLEFTVPCEYIGLGFGSVVPSDGSSVFGAVISCDPLFLSYLDCTEWVRWGYYKRFRSEVVMPDGTALKVWIYTGQARREGLRPPESYIQRILAEGVKLSFPNEYLIGISRLPKINVFELDATFNMAAPMQPRLIPRLLKPFVNLHDQAREQLCKILS